MEGNTDALDVTAVAVDSLARNGHAVASATFYWSNQVTGPSVPGWDTQVHLWVAVADRPTAKL